MQERLVKSIPLSISTILALSGVVLFLLFKLPAAAIHFGDSNLYLYAASLLLHGQLPYRDFVVVAPPFLLVFLMPFVWVFGNNFLFYQYISIILDALTAFCLYLIVRKLKSPLAFISPAVFLFSLTILSTTDFFTGIQLVNLFLSLAILLLIYNRFLSAGVFFALATTTKFYAFLPFIGFAAFYLKQIKSFTRLFLGFTLAFAMVLLPFIILAPDQTFQYLVLHHLNRPEGNSRIELFSAFVSSEWQFIVLAILGALTNRKTLSLKRLRCRSKS